MTRRSPEVVDGALGFQHHGSPRDASYVWEALDILADEVRAQREILARLALVPESLRVLIDGAHGNGARASLEWCARLVERALKGES